MNLSNILDTDLCTVLSDNTKNEALITLIDLIVKKRKLSESERESITQQIFYREQLMSTGIGLGIGIPHIRYEGVTEPVIALGIRKEGIQDYHSIDNEPVTILVMIIVGKDQHKQHIRLLSQVVSLLKDESVKTALLESETSDTIYRLFTGDSNDS